MAQRVLVQLIDDLDGTMADDIETVEFGLDGVTYEIDLGAVNSGRLRDSLRDFVAKARRTGGRPKRAAVTHTIVGEVRTREQTRAVREWARRNGHALADRGRIPVGIIEEFEKAHR